MAWSIADTVVTATFGSILLLMGVGSILFTWLGCLVLGAHLQKIALQQAPPEVGPWTMILIARNIIVSLVIISGPLVIVNPIIVYKGLLVTYAVNLGGAVSLFFLGAFIYPTVSYIRSLGNRNRRPCFC